MYRIKEDNRTLPKDQRNLLADRFGQLYPSHCKIGDLYKPWYFYADKEGCPRTGCHRDIDQVCLIFKIEKIELDPSEIVSTSFSLSPRTKHRSSYCVGCNSPPIPNEGFTNDIEVNGQKTEIICTKHHIRNSPIRIDLLEDPELKQIRCFDGHHRMLSCEHLEIPIKAIVYHLYHMDTPVDWLKHYAACRSHVFNDITFALDVALCSSAMTTLDPRTRELIRMILINEEGRS